MNQEMTSERLGLIDFLELSDILLRHGTFRFRVGSWSMYPALRKGDQLMVEPASPAQLQVGDLLLFHHHGQLICHRLLSLENVGPGARIVTKGDATTGPGEVLEPGQILGRVVAEIMRGLVWRGFEYSIGVPEGRRWYRYERLCRDRPAPKLNDQQGFHLLAKLGGSAVASLHAVRRGEEYRLEALYVRIRYRGLGVASQLLAFACHLASRSGAGRLLATVEAENSAALSLFDKMGFRLLTGSEPDGTAVLCRDLPG